MPVIDAHHHFWWTARRPHKFPPGFGNSLARDFTPDDLQPELTRSGIDGTVLVQSLNSFEETLEYLDLANAHDFVRGVVGWVPMSDPKECARALDRLRKNRKFVGVRHLDNFEPDPAWLELPTVIESIGLLEKANLVFEAIPINAPQLGSFLAMSGRFPKMRLNLNHLGRPPLPEQRWEPWASQMARAAANPNISVKLSVGGDVASRWRWSTDQIRGYVEHVLSLFGADRVMIASNWPVILLSGSFADVWSGSKSLLAGLTPRDRAAVLGDTAVKIYRLK
ncbi:MAG: amidohydrolase family protein [Xanthobacteraceae bacterium]